MNDAVLGAIMRTWQAIGSDWLDLDPDPDATSMAEAVLDAGRLEMYGGLDPENLKAFRALPIDDQYAVAIKLFSPLQ